MKYLKQLLGLLRLLGLITGFVLVNTALAQITNWDSSPLNYNNSPLNYISTNGVYDNNGNRIGYQTQSPSGVTNVFDNNGNRIGYSPAGTKP